MHIRIQNGNREGISVITLNEYMAIAKARLNHVYAREVSDDPQERAAPIEVREQV